MTKLIFRTFGLYDSYGLLFFFFFVYGCLLSGLDRMYNSTLRREKIPSGKVGCVLLFHDTSSSSLLVSLFFLHKILEGGYFNFKVLVFLCVVREEKKKLSEWNVCLWITLNNNCAPLTYTHEWSNQRTNRNEILKAAKKKEKKSFGGVGKKCPEVKSNLSL